MHCAFEAFTEKKLKFQWNMGLGKSHRPKGLEKPGGLLPYKPSD